MDQPTAGPPEGTGPPPAAALAPPGAETPDAAPPGAGTPDAAPPGAGTPGAGIPGAGAEPDPVFEYDAAQHPPTRRVQMVALDPRWLRRTMIIVLAFLIGAQLAEFTWHALGDFLFNLLLAWLLAVSFDPVVRWLAGRGMKRGLATGIVAMSSILLLVTFIAVFGGLLFTQLEQLITGLPDLVVDVTAWINQRFHTTLDPDTLIETLNLSPQQLASIAGNLAGGVFGILASVVGLLFNVLTVAVFAFYFSADSPRIKRTIASWLPPRSQLVFVNVWDIAVTKAGGFVISRLALASMSAFCHSLFFWILDIPFWLPMGIFAGVTSQFIPTIGTYIGIAFPALFAAFDDPWDVLWIIIFATVYQQIENYVFTPKVSNRTMDIHAGVALAAVFIGAALFGAIGALIGIPLVAIVIAVIEAYGQRYQLAPELVARAARSGLTVTAEEAAGAGLEPDDVARLEQQHEREATQRGGRRRRQEPDL